MARGRSQSNGRGSQETPSARATTKTSAAALDRVLNALALNQLADRTELTLALRKTFGGDRDIPQVLGYNQKPKFKHFLHRYLRQDIAARVIDLPVKKTWSNDIEITAPDEERGRPAPFNFDEINRHLRLVRKLVRLDRLACLGEYAVLLIGIDDELELSDPVEEGRISKLDDILYLSVFSQEAAEIRETDTEPTSPRFGLPSVYDIHIRVDPAKDRTQKMAVHHSRVLHVAEDGIDNDIFGTPRLLGIVDRLEDLEKIVGGSAEMFWQGAVQAIVAKIDKDAKLPPQTLDELREEIEAWGHKLQRFMRVKGVDITALPVTTPDPRGIFEVLIGLIAAHANIPQRMLIGSERGELASTHDRETFAEMIEARRDSFAEPVILRPLLELFQWWGALPQGAFEIKWPPVLSLTEMDWADIRLKNTQALKNIAPAGFPEGVARRSELRKLMQMPEILPDDLTDDEPFGPMPTERGSMPTVDRE